MSELELGQATIVYEDPDEGRTEMTLENERVVYVRDHWAVKTDTDEEGNDLMLQIPHHRVHYVERNVERFEEEASTMRNRIETFADQLRDKLPVSDERDSDDSDPITLGESDDSR